MGHPVYRRDYLTLQLNYGIGLHQWDKVIDDFVSTSATTVIPIRSEQLQMAYENQWSNTIKALRFEKETLKEITTVKVNEHYKSIQGFPQYYQQFIRNLNNLYEKMRRQIAVDKLGNYSRRLDKDIDEIHIEYLKGQLEKHDVYAEGLDNHLKLLKELNNFSLYFKWFQKPFVSPTKEAYSIQSHEAVDDISTFKSALLKIPDSQPIYLKIGDGHHKQTSLEIQFIYKKLRFKNCEMIPTFEYDFLAKNIDKFTAIP